MLFDPIINLVIFISSFVPDDPTVLIVPGLACVAVVFLLARFIPFVWLLIEIYLRPGIPLTKFGLRGSWAVVTGASDGIGKEFALQLARKGYNIVLVSRTESKLHGVAAAITSKYPKIKTKLLAMDFAHSSAADWSALASTVENLDVAILINNVGISHKFPEPFVKTRLDQIRSIIEVNCFATLRVTQIVSEGMVNRRRGLILTMSSFAGIFPTPLLATYAGSKSFLSTWSTALGAELAPCGITVNCVQSHLVVSSMSKIRQPTLLIPTPRLFVRDVLAKVGRGCGSQFVPYNSTPYWTHAIIQWTLESLLGRYSSLLLWYNKSMHESIRYRALKKEEREAKMG